MNSYNGFTGHQREQGDKLLKEAIAKGIIPDPMTQPCFICGQNEGIRHYHNEDYSPENIIENARCVCWRCHMMIHSRFRNPEAVAQYFIGVVLYGKKYPPVFRHDFKIIDDMNQQLTTEKKIRHKQPDLFDTKDNK